MTLYLSTVFGRESCKTEISRYITRNIKDYTSPIYSTVDTARKNEKQLENAIFKEVAATTY